MNKEEILAKSRQENEGKSDEREVAAIGAASNVGMIVGAVVCIVLTLISRYIIHKPEVAFAALLLFFAMRVSQDITLSIKLKERTRVIYCILEAIAVIIFAVAFILIML